MNNLAPMKNCPGGVQGNLNWMPGYYILIGTTFQRKNLLPIGSIFFPLIVAPFLTWFPLHCYSHTHSMAPIKISTASKK